MDNMARESKDFGSIQGSCTSESDTDSALQTTQQPHRFSWLRRHRWQLPSSGEGNSSRKGRRREPRRSSTTARVVRWLMKKTRTGRRKRECTSYDADRPSSSGGEKGIHKSVLAPQGLQLFIVCYFAYAILYFTRKPFSVVKEEMRSQLGISTFVLGWVDTAFLGCYAGGQLIMPLCISKLSIQQLNSLLISCFFGSFVAAFVFGCTSTPLGLVLVWGLNGLVHSPAFPILIKILSAEVPPEARGSVMGIWTTSQQFGGIAATAFCSFVDWGVGWRWVFCSSAFLCLLGGLILRMLLPKLTTRAFIAVSPVRSKFDTTRGELCGAECPVVVGKASSLCGLPLVELSSGKQLCSTSFCPSVELQVLAKGEVGEYAFQTTHEALDGVRQPALHAFSATGVEAPLKAYFMDTKPLVPGANARGGAFDGPRRKATLPGLENTKPHTLKIVELLSSTVGTSTSERSVEEFPACKDHDVCFQAVQSQDLPFRLSGMIMFCSFAYFFVKFVRYTLAFWLPFFLARHCNLSVTSAGLSSMILDIGGVAGAVIGGIVADKLLRGRRMGMAALMCVATGVCLFMVAISCQQLGNLRFSKESLLLEEQIGFQGLQRALQEDWSRLDDDSRRIRQKLPLAMQQIVGRTELALEEQTQRQPFHSRHPEIRDLQAEDSQKQQKLYVQSLGKTPLPNIAQAPPSSTGFGDGEPEAPNTGAEKGTEYVEVESSSREKEKRIASVQENHKEQAMLLKATIEAKGIRLKEEIAWRLKQLLGCMLLVGFFNAVPDSVLGASAAQDLLEMPGAVRSNVASVSAFINAVGALGALFQGVCTAAVSELYGWDVLFGLLCLLSLLSAILLFPAAFREKSKG